MSRLFSFILEIAEPDGETDEFPETISTWDLTHDYLIGEGLHPDFLKHVWGWTENGLADNSPLRRGIPTINDSMCSEKFHEFESDVVGWMTGSELMERWENIPSRNGFGEATEWFMEIVECICLRFGRQHLRITCAFLN